MLIYSLVFFLAVVLLLLSLLIQKRYFRNVLAVLPLIILSLVTGTRYYMGGYDIYNYANIFNMTPYLGNFHLWNTFKSEGFLGAEIGYKFINSLVKSLGFNFFGFTLIVSIFFYICVYVGLSKFTENMNLVIVVLMYKAFLGLTFIYMRQCITVGIFLLAIKYIYKSKPIKYIVLILVAATIHFSAIFLLPFYFLKFIKLTRKGIILFSVIFTFSFLISLLNIDLLSHLHVLSGFFSDAGQEKLDSVAGGNSLYQGGTNILHLGEFLVLDGFLILNFDKIKLDEKKDLMIKLFLSVLPFYSLFANEGILVRMPFYFLLAYALVIEYIVDKKNISIKLLVYATVAMISFIGMYKYAAQFDAGAMFVYKSFLEYNLSIFS